MTVEKATFIIGGCGLLGHHIVTYLLETSDVTSITVFDISTNNNRYNSSRVEYITGSITSKQDLLNAFQKTEPQVIINTVSPNFLVPDVRLHEEVNITGTRNVLDCAIECRIRILVHTSSSAVIQNAWEDLIMVNETRPLAENPVNGGPYECTKKTGEQMVLKANRQNGLLTTALRPCTVFGEGDNTMTKSMFELAQKGQLKYQLGSGKNLFDSIYAGNKLLEASRATEPIPDSKRVDGEAFFVTNDDPWPFWEFSRVVAKEIGKPVADEDVWVIPLGIVLFLIGISEWVVWAVTLGGQPKITTAMFKSSAMVRTFDITKAKERLGYKPAVSMKEGIKRSVQWRLTHPS